MGKNDRYPVFGDAPKPASTGVVGGGAPGGGKGGGFEMTLGKALIGVFVGFPVLFFLGVKVVDCKKEGDGARGVGGGGVQCDARGVQLREKWLVTVEREFDDASPHASGLRGEGACTVKIVSRNLSCDESSIVMQEKGSPFLLRALEHGFTTYVCVDVSNEARVEFPLRRVYGR